MKVGDKVRFVKDNGYIFKPYTMEECRGILGYVEGKYCGVYVLLKDYKTPIVTFRETHAYRFPLDCLVLDTWEQEDLD